MGSSWTEGPQGGLVTPLVMPEHYPYKKVSISLNVREGGVTLCIEILPTYRFLQVRRREAGPDGRRGKDYVLVVGSERAIKCATGARSRINTTC